MRRWLKVGIGVSVLVILVLLILVYADLFGFDGPRSGTVTAPTLDAASTQVIYRIDAAQSQASYTVDEIFAGQEVSTATGITRQIAGDILINMADYSESQVGTIVINVEQFESDSGLRDRRLRREYLDSSTYPEAVFVPQEMIGFPDEIVMGNTYTFELTGDLTVRETTQPTTWNVSVTPNGDTLTGHAETMILMSDFGVGPINVAGFVETSDEVSLRFDFVAVAVCEGSDTC
jgi:polyisoprenoid-binding protein YceI